jgi:hypothetical protein
MDKIRNEKDPIRLTRRGKIASGVLAIVAGAGAIFGVVKAYEATGPEVSGEQYHLVEPGDTTWDIAKREVEGGASRTESVVNKIVDNNPAVYENGNAALGPEDVGASIVIPKEVK